MTRFLKTHEWKLQQIIVEIFWNVHTLLWNWWNLNVIKVSNNCWAKCETLKFLIFYRFYLIKQVVFIFKSRKFNTSFTTLYSINWKKILIIGWFLFLDIHASSLFRYIHSFFSLQLLRKLLKLIKILTRYLNG